MQFFEDEHFSWRVLLVESLVIMLSVFLGFVLNSWRASQSQQKNADTAMKSITAEMQHNRQQVNDHLPTFRNVADTLGYIASHEGKDTPMELINIPGGQGLSIPLLRRSAFETAQSTGALSHIDFEQANLIFAYYRQLKLYTNLLNQIINGFIEGRYQTVQDWLNVYTLLANNGELVNRPRFTKLLNHLQNTYDIKETHVGVH